MAVISLVFSGTLSWPFHDSVFDEILQERVAPRGHRRNRRGIKRKMSNFPLGRRTDKPPPPVDIEKAIRVLK